MTNEELTTRSLVWLNIILNKEVLKKTRDRVVIAEITDLLNSPESKQLLKRWDADDFEWLEKSRMFD